MTGIHTHCFPKKSFRLAFLCALIVVCSVGASQSSAAVNSGPKDGKPASAAPARNANWAVPVDRNINLYRVTPMFYRSAQFRKTQVTELEDLGIRTSIDLREFHSDSFDLKGSPIRQVRVRMYTWRITDQAVITALVAIHRAEATGPVLLHCQHGADRTGLITAMYRIVYQGWTKDAALDELLHGGYGYHPIWRNIPEYIRNVNVNKIKSAVDLELAKQSGTEAAPQRGQPIP